MTMSAVRKKIAAHCALALASLCAVLFVCEIGLRLAYGASLNPAKNFLLEVVRNAQACSIEVVDAWASLQRYLHTHRPDGMLRLFIAHPEGHVFGHMSVEGNELIAMLLEQRIRGETVAAARNAMWNSLLESDTQESMATDLNLCPLLEHLHD